jgi:hypothetical protein
MTLEPCPFCGSEAEFVSDCMGGKYVMCTHPGCQATCRYSGQPDKAIAAWNRRAHIAQHAEMVAKLRDVTKGMRTVSRLAGEHDLRLRDTSAAWADQIDAALLDAQPATNVSESSSKLVDAKPSGEPAQAVVHKDIEWLDRENHYLRRQMKAVWDYLNPNASNDMDWCDEIIIAIDQRSQDTAPPSAVVNDDAKVDARVIAALKAIAKWGGPNLTAAINSAMTGESHD